jgi:hypothetical protein
MAFICKDPIIYDELHDYSPNAARTKGQAEIIQDVFAFHFWAVAANNESMPLYRCRQVRADKLQGTGEEVFPGDRLYAIPNAGAANDLFVSPNRPAGTAGTDYIFCGWAKEYASGTDSDVLMNFDGTRYDEVV